MEHSLHSESSYDRVCQGHFKLVPASSRYTEPPLRTPHISQGTLQTLCLPAGMA